MNSKFSDHNLIISGVNMWEVNKEDSAKKNFCDTAIPEYNIEEASDELWDSALDWLMNKDLDEVDEAELIKILSSLVAENFPSKNKPKVTKEGGKFKSKNRIPTEVRTLFRRKMKISKILNSVKTENRCVKAKT